MLTFLTKGMRLLARLKRKYAMPRSWLLLYVLLIVVPSSILLYSYYQRTVSILEEEVSGSMLEALKQAGSNLTYRMNHVEDISNSALTSAMLQNFLELSGKETAIAEQMEINKELNKFIQSVQADRNVFRVRLFVDKSLLISGENYNFFTLDSIRQEPWYDRVIKANGGMVWTGVYKESYIDREDAYILSCVRMLRSPNRYDQVAGVLMIDMEAKMVNDILGNISFTETSNIYVTDTEGMIISHEDPSMIGSASLAEPLLAQMAAAKDGISAKTDLNGGERYVLYTEISTQGWKLVGDIPVTDISRRVLKMNQSSGVATFLVIFSLFLVVMFVLIAFIVRYMNRRVKVVISMINKKGIERLEDLDSSYGDFNMLERTVDNLIRRVNTLMQKTYKAEMYEREAQLRVLQAQINPHFLYNTLDTINWLALDRGAKDVSMMIGALAQYFRLSLNKGKDIVSVADELELARVYLEIQTKRFPGLFQFEIQSEPGLGDYVMPKLTLQPIVENALLHGVLGNDGEHSMIRIEARTEAGDLIIAVSDDGAGMEEEQVKRLLLLPPETRAEGKGSSYGLFNVNERIKLYAGEEYGIMIHSRPGSGTTVTVRLKAVRKQA